MQCFIIFAVNITNHMKISYHWLNELINTQLSVEEIAKLLTNTGLEVEHTEEFNSIPGGLKDIVVGKVITCDKHPNADKLKVTTVDIGESAPLHIVCGAPNVAAGQKVLIAKVGAWVHPTKGEPFEIKKSKIRGELSEGMICAEDELSLGESHDGILVLPEHYEIGKPASDYFENYSDYLIEIGLTANRGDAASHLGVARDIRAVTKLPIILPATTIPVHNDEPIKVIIEDTDCIRYSGIVMKNIQVKESPAWLQNKLKVIGIASINNVVDATNYVMHELGQPLHAFDVDAINGNKIIVKKVAPQTLFTTLDKTERKLSGTECMICDDTKPLAIGGVFGGLHSGIQGKTSSIFIESATFIPASVRKTAKAHGLSTDAAFRYERGTDIEMTIPALARVVQLINEIAGGEVCSKLIDVYPNPTVKTEITFSFARFAQLIGKQIPVDEVKAILLALDFEITGETTQELKLLVPLYRTDVTRFADVAEELLRIYGLNNIAIPEHITISVSNSEEDKQFAIRNKVSDWLSNNGFLECVNNSLTKSAYYSEDQQTEAVKMLNPLSADLDMMRMSLQYQLLEVLQYNKNRKAGNLKVYEFGKTYAKTSTGYNEQQHLAVVCCGGLYDEHWLEQPKPTTYYTLKAIVEKVLLQCGIKKWETQYQLQGNLAFETVYALQNKTIVTFGAVDAKVAKNFDLNEEVWFADFNWDTVLALHQQYQVKIKPIAAFPSVRRDLALIVDAQVQYSDIEKLARKTEQQLLKEINVFDVYTGDKIAEGKKSYAISFILQDNEKTLTDEVIDATMKKLLQQFQTALGATLR